TGTLDSRDFDNPLVFQLKPQFYRSHGLQRDWTGDDLPAPPAILAKVVKRIVDPDASDPPKGVIYYRNVGAALSEAVDNDVIYINGEKTREYPVRRVELTKPITVALKPLDEAFQPTLVVDSETPERESFLFKVQKSKLQIEQMHIRLAPGPNYDLRTV